MNWKGVFRATAKNKTHKTTRYLVPSLLLEEEDEEAEEEEEEEVLVAAATTTAVDVDDDEEEAISWAWAGELVAGDEVLLLLVGAAYVATTAGEEEPAADTRAVGWLLLLLSSVELLRTQAALTDERTATRATSCLGENMIFECFFFPLSNNAIRYNTLGGRERQRTVRLSIYRRVCFRSGYKLEMERETKNPSPCLVGRERQLLVGGSE